MMDISTLNRNITSTRLNMQLMETKTPLGNQRDVRSEKKRGLLVIANFDISVDFVAIRAGDFIGLDLLMPMRIPLRFRFLARHPYSYRRHLSLQISFDGHVWVSFTDISVQKQIASSNILFSHRWKSTLLLQCNAKHWMMVRERTMLRLWNAFSQWQRLATGSFGYRACAIWTLNIKCMTSPSMLNYAAMSTANFWILTSMTRASLLRQRKSSDTLLLNSKFIHTLRTHTFHQHYRQTLLHTYSHRRQHSLSSHQFCTIYSIYSK